MNPILGSRIRNMIQWRKKVLFEHEHLERRTSLLRSVNMEIIELIDHCLDLIDVPLADRKPKGYRKKALVVVHPQDPLKDVPPARPSK